MNRKSLALVIIAAFATISCTNQKRAARPNFLFLFADDQRADTIGAWGNPHIRTPNLDHLVEQGFSFRANYNLGSNGGAVCIPSRAMVNSGRAYFRVPNNLAGVKLLPELLGENGYVTFATGKWHNERPSFLRAFQRGKALFFGGMSDHTKVPVEDLSDNHTLVNKRIGAKFSSEMFADAVIEFLSGYKEDKPFYAYVAFTAPHDPRMPPEKYRRMYYESRPPLPDNFMPQHPFDNGNLGGRDENLAAWPRSREVISDQLAEYYGMITHLDEQIGRILRALEASGHAGNTYIVYAADHGLAVGSHGLLGKQSIYEHSQRCPLIFLGPRVPKGGSSNATTYLLDIFPTVCSLAGVPPPANLDGHDLTPIWLGERAKVRDSIFLAYTNLMRSVRDERYKLLQYPQINYTQLFDLETDPDELNNLAQDPAQAARVKALTTHMKEWQHMLGDSQPLTVDTPQPRQRDMAGTKRKPDPWQPEWIVKKYF
jgi:arylsulfatase A-like enzyme